MNKQKQIEMALQIENDKNMALLRNASDGITIMDTSGTLLECSDSICEMLGYQRDELLGMHVSQWDVAIPANELTNFVNAQFEKPFTRHQFETRHIRKDGSIYDAEISCCAIDIDGVLLLFASTRNITKRKQLEKNLLNSKNIIEDLYNNAPCGYHSLDKNGIIININNTELNWLGCSRDEVIGKKFTDFITPEGKNIFKKNYPVFLEKGHIENLEFDLVGKNSEVRHVSISATALKDDEGNFINTRSVAYDITELKATQNALYQLTVDQQIILDNALVGIMKLRNRRIIWTNSAMEKIFGYEKNELVNQSTRILYPDDEMFRFFGVQAYSIIKSGHVYRIQLELVCKNGKKIWIDMSGEKSVGNNLSSLWVMLDISEQKKHQAQVEHIAFHDALTGLPNRLLVSDRLNQALVHADRTEKMLAVCYLDLDGFKPVNDKFGHEAGDKLLIEIAHRMELAVRGNDTVGRLGGDEFVLILNELENEDECQIILQRVIESINEPIELSKQIEVKVGASVGVTIYPNDTDAADILLRHADHAMYQAKRFGRNRTHFYIPD